MVGPENGERLIEPLFATTDASDRLIEAPPPIVALQKAFGGDLGGTVAIPPLLEAVRKARSLGLALTQMLDVRHGETRFQGQVGIVPEDAGCRIQLANWDEGRAGGGSAPRIDADAIALQLDNFLAEAVVYLDGAGNVVAVQTAAADLSEFAQSAKAARGTHWRTLVGSDVERPENAQATSLRSDTNEAEEEIVPIRGSRRQWRLRLPGDSATPALLLIPETGLDEEGAAEEDLLPKDLLGGVLTRVLRDPVRAIVDRAVRLESRMAGPLPDAYGEYARDMVVASRHLSEMTEELGTVEAIGGGTLRPAREPVELRAVAVEARDLLSFRAIERSMEIAITGEAPIALADRRRVLQVALNLLGNALAYAREGTEITLSCGSGHGQAWLSVVDQGPGLAPEERDRVFDAYERLGRSGGGTGLGLTIAWRLAWSMDGELTVDSKKGEGSTFTLLLPLVR